jgi:hypothetical protein
LQVGFISRVTSGAVGALRRYLTRQKNRGRSFAMIRVNGKECWTLFDTGARNTYVTPAVASVLQTAKARQPFKSAIGGTVKETTEPALLEAQVEGRRISTHAMVIDEIGKDEEGVAIDVLFGALAMQQWGIRLIPDEDRLDLTHYPKEFLEF